MKGPLAAQRDTFLEWLARRERARDLRRAQKWEAARREAQRQRSLLVGAALLAAVFCLFLAVA